MNTSDEWWRWVVGLAITLITVAIGHVTVRSNRNDDRVREDFKYIWKEIEALRDENKGLREIVFKDMASKTDLKDAEERIIREINRAVGQAK